MYKRHATAYRDAEILGSSREQLVPVLYRHLLSNLRKGTQQIRDGDLEGKSDSLGRSTEILYELLGSLDQARGGELAQRLAALYAYFLNELQEIGRSLDVTRLERMTSLIDSLHGAWAQAARSLEDGRDGGSLGGTV